MLVEKITSRQNPLIKRFRRVRAGAERRFVFLEGVRLLEEALSAGVHFESIAYSSELTSTDRGSALLDSLQGVPCRGAFVTKLVMDGISDTDNPQGVAAVVSRPYWTLADAFAIEPAFLLIADQLQDPGNLGAIIRTAEAAGSTGVIATRGTVDPFNCKALRASMGSAFRMPVVTDASRSELIEFCGEQEVGIIAAQSPRPGLSDAKSASKIYSSVDLTGAIAILVGREASGLASGAITHADQVVHIPMADRLDSLNVATAAAVLLYESARQRGFRFEN